MRIHEGTIKLLNISEEILQIRHYGGFKERRTIIYTWHKLYGKMFAKLIIQISPYVNINYEQ